MKKYLIIVASMLLVGACGKTTKQFITVSGPSNPGSGTTPPEGSSSGGGSFGDRPSMIILDRAKNELAKSLRATNSGVFKNLPEGWTQEKLAHVVENIRIEKNNPGKPRYNRTLKFDYEEKNEQIVALKLFFDTNATVPVDVYTEEQLKPYIDQTKMDLLHETAHLLKVGLSEQTDVQAGVFAKRIIDVIEQDNFVCDSLSVPENFLKMYLSPLNASMVTKIMDAHRNPQPETPDYYLKRTFMNMMINRATGKALHYGSTNDAVKYFKENKSPFFFDRAVKQEESDKNNPVRIGLFQIAPEAKNQMNYTVGIDPASNGNLSYTLNQSDMSLYDIKDLYNPACSVKTEYNAKVSLNIQVLKDQIVAQYHFDDNKVVKYVDRTNAQAMEESAVCKEGVDKRIAKDTEESLSQFRQDFSSRNRSANKDPKDGLKEAEAQSLEDIKKSLFLTNFCIIPHPQSQDTLIDTLSSNNMDAQIQDCQQGTKSAQGSFAMKCSESYKALDISDLFK